MHRDALGRVPPVGTHEAVCPLLVGGPERSDQHIAHARQIARSGVCPPRHRGVRRCSWSQRAGRQICVLGQIGESGEFRLAHSLRLDDPNPQPKEIVDCTNEFVASELSQLRTPWVV